MCCPDIFLVGGLWIDRRIPTFQVQTDFFLGHLEKSNFWGEIIIISKANFLIIKISPQKNYFSKIWNFSIYW